MADRRMLWKRVCRSRKVNCLSDRAALLWTWAIPWFDRDGYLEVEPDFVSESIFPKKKVMEEEAKELVFEIFESKLWLPFIHNSGKLIAKDPRFREFQTNQYDREGKSSLIDECSPITLEQLAEHSPTTRHKLNKEKLREEKLREAKEREYEGKPKKEKSGTALTSKTEDQKKELQDLVLKINTMFPSFRLNLFLQNHNRAHPEAVLHTLRKLIEYPEKIGDVENPMALCESIIKIEDKNYNAADFYSKESKDKINFNEFLEKLKEIQGKYTNP